ncbi:hypothetical protein [Halegenticoccus tardaugens]|uniref:hypothetical protein n=1 Tax=Halegenticoccus tardaugens TaxID=2071624 RepID=UPI00100BFAA3|nr:hypothetical protein [Halegenticoccus tardaugens]
MAAEFTDAQTGKRVLDRRGGEVGTVNDVRNGELYVEVGPGVDEETLDELGWGGPVHRGVHRLEARFVTETTDEAVRLRV